MPGFKYYFNSTTMYGRANTAKVTYASIAILYLYYRAKKSTNVKTEPPAAPEPPQPIDIAPPTPPDMCEPDPTKECYKCKIMAEPPAASASETSCAAANVDIGKPTYANTEEIMSAPKQESPAPAQNTQGVLPAKEEDEFIIMKSRRQTSCFE